MSDSIDPWTVGYGDIQKLKYVSTIGDLEDAALAVLGRVQSSFQTGVHGLDRVAPGEWADVPSPNGGESILRLHLFEIRSAHVRRSKAAVRELN